MSNSLATARVTDEAPRPTPVMSCNRCGFPVPVLRWGCKNPCHNCGTMYPHGDCSD